MALTWWDIVTAAVVGNAIWSLLLFSISVLYQIGKEIGRGYAKGVRADGE